jgi:glycosyltransferase involved in cell wall biosynthesis
MRILFFLSSLELGGAERQALLLAEHLQNEKHDVQIWGLERPGKVSLFCDAKKIIWKSCPYWKGNLFQRIKIIFNTTLNIREFNPDIIIPFGGMPSFLCAISWRFTKAIACIWGERDIGLSRYWFDEYSFAIRLATCVVTNSYEGKEYIKREYNKNLDIRVINNGVFSNAPEETREKWRERLGAKESTLVYCMVANLSNLKNHSLLLEAWYHATKTAAIPDDAILVLAGREDDMADLLKQKVIDYGMSDKVKFLGPVDDISGLLATVDVGVLCSNSEGQSNAILEYMYAGLPIIASDLPSIREILHDTGSCLFRKDSVEELTTALGQMTSADRRYKIGRYNVERCRQLYLPEKMFNGYKNLLNEMLNKKKKKISMGDWHAIIIWFLNMFISGCKRRFINLIKKIIKILLGRHASKVKNYLKYLIIRK